MSTAARTLRYYLFGHDRRAPRGVDPADMGTCFGMEMSLDDPPPAAPPTVVKPAVPHWWQRLAVRKPVGV